MTPGALTHYLNQPYPAAWAMQQLFSTTQPITIFDIGACEGEETIRFAKMFPYANIHTFEPLPENRHLIAENFKTFGITQAQLSPLALCDQTGRSTFYVSSGEPAEKFSGEEWNYGNKSSSLLAPAADDPMHGWITFDQTIEVACGRLDDYCREHRIRQIDWLHMDVQGAEYLVICGGCDILKRTRAVWLETMDQAVYQDQKLRPDIENKMRSLGFQLVASNIRKEEQDQLFIQRRIPANWRFLLLQMIRKAWALIRMKLGAFRALYK